LYTHGRDAIHNGYNYAFAQAIRKYGIDNFVIEEIERFKAQTKRDLKPVLDEAEKKYIKQYNSYLKGYNSTKGGDGTVGFKLSEEHKRKISESLQGIKHTDECLKKLSEANKRKWADIPRDKALSDKMKRIRSVQLLDEKWYANNKAAREKAKKPVAQLTKEGKRISIYKSATDAQMQTNIHSTSVSSVCLGKRRSAGGYKWEFVNG
jgi:group I intron endonuclease